MRVLAVAQALLDVEFKEELLRKTGFLTHIGGNHHIILSGMGVGLCGKLQAGVVGGEAVAFDLLEHGGVVRRVAYDGNVLPVLCGAAHH